MDMKKIAKEKSNRVYGWKVNQSRKKVINYMSNGKAMITHLLPGLIKRHSIVIKVIMIIIVIV